MQTKSDTERMKEYRLQVRETFQSFSDQALLFQSARIVGGIDREECDRELARRHFFSQDDDVAPYYGIDLPDDPLDK